MSDRDRETRFANDTIILRASSSRRRQLPSIEEAWNLPISAEMSSRQQQQQQAPGGPSYKYGTAPSGPPPPYPQAQAQAKRFKVRFAHEMERVTERGVDSLDLYVQFRLCRCSQARRRYQRTRRNGHRRSTCRRSSSRRYTFYNRVTVI